MNASCWNAPWRVSRLRAAGWWYKEKSLYAFPKRRTRHYSDEFGSRERTNECLKAKALLPLLLLCFNGESWVRCASLSRSRCVYGWARARNISLVSTADSSARYKRRHLIRASLKQHTQNRPHTHARVHTHTHTHTHSRQFKNIYLTDKLKINGFMHNLEFFLFILVVFTPRWVIPYKNSLG